MKTEQKRIFISDLPETATEEEIRSTFGEYGKVTGIEIKERKELGPKNLTLFFGYVNIEIDDFTLQKCFQDFAQNEWHGYYVRLQVARESFLDRLKREREENEGKSSTAPVAVKQTELKVNGVQKKVASSSSSSSESEDEVPVKKEVKRVKKKEIKEESSSSSSESENEPEEKLDIVIKNNKGKLVSKDGLKIESVGKEPIIKIDLSKKKASNVNQSEANLKRLQSMREMKKSYQSQKNLIKNALSTVDSKRNNKIVFNEDADDNLEANQSQNINKSNKKALFDEDESDEENLDSNFKIKQQFEGKSGQKLLELQSKFKNDKRFTLDERFLENGEDNTETNEYDEDNIEEEKKKEFEILGEILGKTVAPKMLNKNKEEIASTKKSMLRFDPSQPNHLKYEVKNPEVQNSKKRKREDFDEKKQEATAVPEVSKEVFYKVTANLKESLQDSQNQQFSLLSAFGTAKDFDNEENDTENIEKPIKLNNNLMPEKNPFRYDSSDDEDQTEDIMNKEELNNEATNEPKQPKLWSEPFFFQEDDYRLQEGFDFVERMKLDEKSEFSKLRRDLKEIVRSKVRNNQRKNKPFKKKLGGNKKRKMIRIKKALKR